MENNGSTMKRTVKRAAWGIGVFGQILVIIALAITAYVLTPPESEKLEVDQKEYKSE